MWGWRRVNKSPEVRCHCWADSQTHTLPCLQDGRSLYFVAHVKQLTLRKRKQPLTARNRPGTLGEALRVWTVGSASCWTWSQNTHIRQGPLWLRWNGTQNNQDHFILLSQHRPKQKTNKQKPDCCENHKNTELPLLDNMNGNSFFFSFF